MGIDPVRKRDDGPERQRADGDARGVGWRGSEREPNIHESEENREGVRPPPPDRSRTDRRLEVQPNSRRQQAEFDDECRLEGVPQTETHTTGPPGQTGRSGVCTTTSNSQ